MMQRSAQLLVTASVSVGALIGVTGCGSSSPAGPAQSSSSLPATTSAASTPTPSRTPVGAGPEELVLAAYRGMQAAAVRAYAAPRVDHPEVRRYAADKALAGINSTILHYRQRGIVLRGEPVLSPSVTSLDLAANPPTARVEDCIDTTDWVPVEEKTGRSLAAPGQNLRYPVISIAQLISGRWYIMQSTPQRSRSC